MRLTILNILNNNFLIGILSIICPSVIQTKPIDYSPMTDAEALASDWAAVGSYIQNAYETLSGTTGRK